VSAHDHDGCLFTVTVTRKPVEALDLVEADDPRNANAPINASEPRNEPKNDSEVPERDDLKGHSVRLSGQPNPINDLLNKIRETPNADYAALARVLRVSEATVKRNIQKLKQGHRIRRVGSKKTGYWEILE
jgi:ATP-dependent DNA helicase RecG